MSGLCGYWAAADFSVEEVKRPMFVVDVEDELGVEGELVGGIGRRSELAGCVRCEMERWNDGMVVEGKKDVLCCEAPCYEL